MKQSFPIGTANDYTDEEIAKGIPRLHAQFGPAILYLYTNGGACEQLELQLGALLLDHIGQSDRNDLGIASGGEAGETDSHTRLEELVSSLGRRHDLAEERLASTTASQSSRHLHSVSSALKGGQEEYLVDTSKSKRNVARWVKWGNGEDWLWIPAIIDYSSG